MMTNIGVIDGVARFLAGVALLVWSDGRYLSALPEVVAWAVWIAGALLTLTAIFRFCPFYALIGTDSCATAPPRDG